MAIVAVAITRTSIERVGLVLGPIVFGIIFGLRPFHIAPAAHGALAVTLWIAIWWLTEAIPIPVTSLLPVVLFPLVGVGSVGDVARPYADPIIFLLLGGFMLALAVERWGLHHRVALAVLARVGTRADRLLLGFMLATGFLSMWISNSATAMLMVPIGMAVIAQCGASPHGDTESTMVEGVSAPFAGSERGRFGLSLMLGIAYAASIGGIATLIGSPPNAIFAGVAESALGVEVSFVDWLLVAGPLAVVFMLLAWRLLVWLVQPEDVTLPGGSAFVADHRGALGPPSTGERRVALVFALVAGAWITRPFLLDPIFPALSDPAIAIIGAIALFVIPGSPAGERLLRWDDVVRLPWGVLVLLGAGFAIAGAFQRSGLDTAIGHALADMGGYGSLVTVTAVTVAVVTLTEVNSNSATASVFMPVMVGLGINLGVEPLSLMAAAALAASFAFMLPVATPPNAIVFGSGAVTVPQMARVGIWFNLLAIVAIVITVSLWFPVAFGIFH